jgi:hypothetical protein
VVLALILFMRSRVRARERQVRDAEDRGTGGNKSL